MPGTDARAPRPAGRVTEASAKQVSVGRKLGFGQITGKRSSMKTVCADMITRGKVAGCDKVGRQQVKGGAGLNYRKSWKGYVSKGRCYLCPTADHLMLQGFLQ